LGDCSTLFERIDAIERVALRSGYGCNGVGVIVIIVIVIIIIIIIIVIVIGGRLGGASVRVGRASVRAGRASVVRGRGICVVAPSGAVDIPTTSGTRGTTETLVGALYLCFVGASRDGCTGLTDRTAPNISIKRCEADLTSWAASSVRAAISLASYAANSCAHQRSSTCWAADIRSTRVASRATLGAAGANQVASVEALLPFDKGPAYWDFLDLESAWDNVPLLSFGYRMEDGKRAIVPLEEEGQVASIHGLER